VGTGGKCAKRKGVEDKKDSGRKILRRRPHVTLVCGESGFTLRHWASWWKKIDLLPGLGKVRRLGGAKGRKGQGNERNADATMLEKNAANLREGQHVGKPDIAKKQGLGKSREWVKKRGSIKARILRENAGS